MTDDQPQGTAVKSKRSRVGSTTTEFLLRIEHRHEPESCQWDKDLVKIDEEVTEQPDVEPAMQMKHWLHNLNPVEVKPIKRICEPIAVMF